MTNPGTRIASLALLFAGVISIAPLPVRAADAPAAHRSPAQAEEAFGDRDAASDNSGFVRADGRTLLLGGKPFRLRGVNFSNGYAVDLDGSRLGSSPHPSADDFRRVKEMGFNSIRFAFNGDWLDRSPDAFWAWLDRNVQLARQHGIYLVLDLHTPIGSYWLNPLSERVSFAIWTDPEVRARNVALWRQIAARYRDEPYIAAYDILNEPVTTDSTGEQWRKLAQDMLDAIRAVDRHHLVVVGALYGVEGRYRTAGVQRQFLVADDNVMYDFHFYEPVKYTHQYATWIEGPVRDGGSYPDPEVIVPTGGQVLLPGSRIGTPPLVAGTSDWALYDSGPVPVADPAAVAALPVAVVRGAMRGTAYFDSLKVIEYAPDGTFLREVVKDSLAADETLDWHAWQRGEGRGKLASLARQDGIGHGDAASLSVGDVETAGTLAGWSNDGHLFKVKPGNRYRILGYMRGADLDLARDGAPAQIRFELDVYAATPDGRGPSFLERDKAYLEHEMRKLLRFGADNHVPMSVMEFGVVKQAFETPAKGGGQWVADVMDLLAEHDVSFAYWEHRGDPMGIHLPQPGAAERPNAELIAVLEQKLRPHLGAVPITPKRL
jgi:endoglucanase